MTLQQQHNQYAMTPQQRSRLAIQKAANAKAVDNVEKCEYFGSSMMVHIPCDANLVTQPFATGVKTPGDRTYMILFYEDDFNAVAKGLEKSKMFDSVKSVQESGYLKYAKAHGFRYLLINNGDGSFGVYDLLTSDDKTIRSPKGIENLVYAIEDTIAGFESEQSSKTLYVDYQPIEDEYKYDEETRKGYIALKGKGLQARAWMMKTIGEICATKNIAVESGATPEPGYFFVLDEELRDDIFTIHFESVY